MLAVGTVSRIDAVELANYMPHFKIFCVCTDKLTKTVMVDEKTIVKFGQETRVAKKTSCTNSHNADSRSTEN